MTTQFTKNDKADDYLSEEYKLMIDIMLEEEANDKAEYVSLEEIKIRFSKN